MNYLAHLYLTDGSDDAIVGNLLPDFARGSTRALARRYGPTIMAGVLRHRRVDAFTDAHPIVHAAKRRIDERFGLLRGVIVDIYYDHLLARAWARYTDEPLREFSSRCYDALERRVDDLPPTLQRALPLWRAGDLLGSYADPRGIERALRRVDIRVERRTGRRFGLHEALPTLEAARDELAAGFDAFFGEMITHVDAAGTLNR